MSWHVEHVTGSAAYDLIFEDCIARMVVEDQRLMKHAMDRSPEAWIAFYAEQVLGCWGLVPPSLLSDVAYLWLHATAAAEDHVFMITRQSRIEIERVRSRYPRIWGHCLVADRKAQRWIRWLGADFGEPIGQLIPFTLKAANG